MEQSQKKTKEQIFRELASDNPDLMSKVISALAIGDMDRYNEIMDQNPDFLDKFMQKMAEIE